MLQNMRVICKKKGNRITQIIMDIYKEKERAGCCWCHLNKEQTDAMLRAFRAYLCVCVCVWVPVLLFLLPHDGISQAQESDARWRGRKRKQQTMRTPTIHRSSVGWLRYRYIKDIILFITVTWATTIV